MLMSRKQFSELSFWTFDSPKADKILEKLVFSCFQISFFELRKTRKGNANKGPIHVIRNRKIRPAFWNLFKMAMCYGSGAIFTEFLTDIGKITVGRLRPNFMDVCKPQNLNSLCPSFSYEYVESYVCLASEDLVNKSR